MGPPGPASWVFVSVTPLNAIESTKQPSPSSLWADLGVSSMLNGIKTTRLNKLAIFYIFFGAVTIPSADFRHERPASVSVFSLNVREQGHMIPFSLFSRFTIVLKSEDNLEFKVENFTQKFYNLSCREL